VRRAVAGRAEKDRVAEREEPDVPDEEIEGAGEQREAERLHEEHGIHEERRGDDAVVMTRNAITCGADTPGTAGIVVPTYWSVVTVTRRARKARQGAAAIPPP